jgi:AsmA protein
MRKFLIIAILLIVALIGGLWWALGDPNRFKPTLTDLIERETGLWVSLDGDLGWRLWPPVQLIANEVRVDWVRDNPDPLAQVERMQLDVNLWPLLGRDPNLVVTGVLIDGLDANLVQEGDSNNWEPPVTDADAPPTETPADEPAATDLGDAWLIAEVLMRNSRIDYRVDGDLTRVDVEYLQLSDIAPNRDMPLRAALELSMAEEHIPLLIEGRVRFNQTLTQFAASGLQLTGRLGSLELPFDIGLDASADLDADTASVSNGSLRLADAQGSFSVDATGLTEALVLSGQISLPDQRPRDFMRLFELDEFAERIALDARFELDDDRAALRTFAAQLDDSRIDGNAELRFGEPMHARFNLEADRFLIPEADEDETQAAAAGDADIDAADLPLLPLELLEQFTWDGQVRIQQLYYGDARFDDVRIETEKRNGQINAHLRIAEFFGGETDTRIRLDTNAAEPQWHIVPRLSNVQSRSLLDWLDQDLDWVALLLANSELRMRGNTTRALFDTMQGGADFNANDGRISIAMLKEQAMAIAAMAGSTERVESWPDRLDYRRLSGDWQVDGQRHQLTMLLDNLRLEARGDLNLLTEALDMRLNLIVTDDPEYSSLRINPRLIGVALPIRCRGQISAPSCRPDQEAVRDLISTALRDEAEDELRQRLEREVERRGADSTREAAEELLRGLRRR